MSTSLQSAGPQATAGGTGEYAERHAAGFVSGFYRPGPKGLAMSRIGLGTYLGECTDAEDDRYELAVHAALDAGVNVIDTAINYRCQRSEKAVGAGLQRAFASGAVMRSEVIVCSKAGFVPLEDKPPTKRSEYEGYLKRAFFDAGVMHPDEVVSGGHSLAPGFLRHCIARSRTNLGVRTIDVEYIHNPEEQLGAAAWGIVRERLRAAFEVMEEAIAAGDVASYGVATWTGLRVARGTKGHLSLEALVELARDVAGEAHHFRVVQLPLSLAMPEAVNTPTQPLAGAVVPAIEAAAALGLTVVTSAPLAQGQLTQGLPPAVAAMFPDAQTDAERALAFAGSQPGVTTTLVGTRRTAHLHANLRFGRAG